MSTDISVVAIYGHLGQPHADPVSNLRSGEYRRLLDYGGSYTIVAQAAETIYLIRSPSSPYAYAYAYANGKAGHGATVIEAAQDARLSIELNVKCLGAYASIGRRFGRETLAQNVYSVPRGSVIALNQNTACQVVSVPFHAHLTEYSCSFHEIFDALIETCRQASNEPFSLFTSAGLDSRLLLALFLHLGRPPVNLLVVGRKGQTDYDVVHTIGARLGIPVISARLTAPVYLSNSENVARNTDGLCAFDHWAGFVHASEFRLNEARVVFGWGGEILRASHEDSGILTLARNAFASRLSAWRWLQRRLSPEQVLVHARRVFGPQIDIDDVVACAWAKVLSDFDLASFEALQRFAIEREILDDASQDMQGIRAMLPLEVRLPFVDDTVYRLSWRLPKALRLGSNFHRKAIAKAYPALLSMPTSCCETPLRRHAPIGYWVRRRRWISDYVSYTDPMAIHGSNFTAICRPRIAALGDSVDQDYIDWLFSRPNCTYEVGFLLWRLFAAGEWLRGSALGHGCDTH